MTFTGEMTLWLGKLEVKIKQSAAATPRATPSSICRSQNICFSGDLVEADAACYTGDAYLADWPHAGQPGRHEVRQAGARPRPGADDAGAVQKGLAYTRDFVSTLYKARQEAVAQGMDLNATMKHTRKAMDPKFGQVFIYEHCLPFDVTRAHDEASGIRDPRIWTAERDKKCGTRCSKRPLRRYAASPFASQDRWSPGEQTISDRCVLIADFQQSPAPSLYKRQSYLFKKPITKRRQDAMHLHLPQVRVRRPPELAEQRSGHYPVVSLAPGPWAVHGH
jgi:hypothetical protein